MAKNVAVGLLRPPHVFFYEIDSNDKQFADQFISYTRFKFDENFAVYKTKHGYHLIAYPYSRKTFGLFSKWFPSDFTKKLRSRWNRKDPQVLRISEKWDLKTGRITSPAPKFICGNLKLNNLVNEIQKYKVLYYAK